MKDSQRKAMHSKSKKYPYGYWITPNGTIIPKSKPFTDKQWKKIAEITKYNAGIRTYKNGEIKKI